MEEYGYEAMNPNNASKNYDLGRGGIYQFDLEGRIVAIGHQPNASVTFVYKLIDLTLPTSFDTINMPTTY